MLEIAGSEECAYSQKWLKKKLEERYSHHIVFVQSGGSTTKVCLRNMVDYLVTEEWYNQRMSDVEDEAERIIKTAAKLIMEDIRSVKYENEFYPAKESMGDLTTNREWMPPYLQVMMSYLVKAPLKQASLGQGIVQATRPRSCLPPILLGIGIDVDHVLGSRWLLDYLSRFGFSVTYDEIKRFKQSVLKNDSTEVRIDEGAFAQWSADNVDHNIRTLNGKGCLHAMGIICSITSKSSTSMFQTQALKREKVMKVREICKGRAIQIKEYIPSEATGLSKLKFQELTCLKSKTTVVQNSRIDYLWDSAVLFRQYERLNWSGYMTNISRGTYPGKSTIMFLQIIDLSPTDPTCIYTTLEFVIDQEKSLNIRMPVLTFDQALWLKATEIANCKSMNIVLILGGFHLMMSFMGGIGSLMKGSGLLEALSTCYGVNAIEQMMSGKAVSRGLRGHVLAASALQRKLMTPLFPNSNLQTHSYNNEIDQTDIEFDSYNECENDEDIESIDQEYMEVE